MILKSALSICSKQNPKVNKMVGILPAIPSIAQVLQSINQPQVPNIQIGSADVDANSAAAAVSIPSAGSVGGGTSGSIDTTA